MPHTSSSERYTLKQVANLLNVHIGTVYRWTLRGVRGKRLRSYLIGGRRYVDADDLSRFINSHETQNHQTRSEPERSRTAQERLRYFGVPKQQGGQQ